MSSVNHRISVLSSLSLLCVVLVAGLLSLGGCGTPDAKAQSAMRRLALGSIDATDLPLGWGQRRSSAIEEANGAGRSVTYYGANAVTQPFVNVGHRIVIYDSQADSITGYAQSVEESIPPTHADVWRQPPELDFQGHADQLTIACMSVHINDIPARSCSVIARYGDMVTHLHAQVFEDRWLTMTQFRHLVERLDQRMQDARVSTKTPAQ